MSWVRIHDGAMTHPKIVALSDRAFRLWVWGLSYAQQHLTDGYLSGAALPPRASESASMLVLRRLWHAGPEGGFQIHDYLDWNEPKATVLQKRRLAKERMLNVRSDRSRERSQQQQQRTSREVLSGLSVGNSSFTLTERGSGGKPSQNGGKSDETRGKVDEKRPVFTGQRLTIFQWMIDQFERILGPEVAEKFDIPAWLFDLDASAVRDGLVIPRRDGMAWLEVQLIAEASRRGIAIQMATTAVLPSSPEAMLAKIQQEDADDWRRERR